jgi:hypothetical protein
LAEPSFELSPIAPMDGSMHFGLGGHSWHRIKTQETGFFALAVGSHQVFS